MQSYCFRDGQVEVGVIEHEGVECVSLGASVMGKWVTGYTSLDGDQITLQTWCGQTVLDCRTTVIERYHNGAFALVFRLGKRRFIAGYALGDGMLFRGTLVRGTENEARSAALRVTDDFATLDGEADDL